MAFRGLLPIMVAVIKASQLARRGHGDNMSGSLNFLKVG